MKKNGIVRLLVCTLIIGAAVAAAFVYISKMKNKNMEADTDIKDDFAEPVEAEDLTASREYVPIQLDSEKKTEETSV